MRRGKKKGEKSLKFREFTTMNEEEVTLLLSRREKENKALLLILIEIVDDEDGLSLSIFNSLSSSHFQLVYF